MYALFYVYIWIYTPTYTHASIYQCGFIHPHVRTLLCIYVHMTLSIEIETLSRSTRSRNSDLSVSCGTKSNWDFGCAIRAGPNVCGKKSGGLSIRGFIYPGVWAAGIWAIKISPGIWAPIFFPILIWTYHDGAAAAWARCASPPRAHLNLYWEIWVSGFGG